MVCNGLKTVNSVASLQEEVGKRRPGDKVNIFSKVLGSTRGIWKFECFCEVNGKLVCSANILCAEREK